MRTFVAVIGLSALFGALAVAENFSGKLMDAACPDQQKAEVACQPSNSTTAFVLEQAGKMYKLDATGNVKAAEALKSRADRAADPNAPKTPVMAKITGTLAGDTIKVDKVEVQ
jgi:hypothetical protein